MPSLALSMIVRDAADTLVQCLASASDVVSEIVVGDTGSSDNTIALAQSFGARVFSVPWKDDFAEARNRALAEVCSDWVLVLDADETLDVGCLSSILPLLDNSSISGYQVTIRNYVLSLQDRVWDRPAVPNDSKLAAARSFPAYVEHQNVRLFRRQPDIFFVGRVHESVGPRLQQLKRKIGEAPFLIHHFGLAASKEKRAQKNVFYRELGRRKVREMPQNAQAHFELGLVEFDNFGNYEDAGDLFRRAVQLEPSLGVAWFFLGLAHLRQERFADALESFAQAETQGHRTAPLSESQGDAHYNTGDFAGAIRHYESALRLEPSNPAVESKLGLAKLRAGSARDEGERHFRHAIELRPSSGELYDRFIAALVWLDDVCQAAVVAEQKIAAISVAQAADFLRAASLWAKLENWPRTLAMLKAGLEAYPENASLRDTLAALKQELKTSNHASA